MSDTTLYGGRPGRRFRVIAGCPALLAIVLTCFAPAAMAAEPGETRCGATGMAEQYQCMGTRCEWRNTYQRCANTNTAPSCNPGDTKCGADGRVMLCERIGVNTMWNRQMSTCSTDRDPADNAPPGYGGYGAQPYSAPSYGGGFSGGSASEPRVCSPGQQECGTDRQIRRCVMQGGRPAWETVAGSRCGQSGFRN